MVLQIWFVPVVYIIKLDKITVGLSVFCLLVCAILLFTPLIFEKFVSSSPFIFVSTHVLLYNIVVVYYR